MAFGDSPLGDWVCISKRLLCRLKQILAVEKERDPFGRWFDQNLHAQKITPPGPFGESSGEQMHTNNYIDLYSNSNSGSSGRGRILRWKARESSADSRKVL